MSDVQVTLDLAWTYGVTDRDGRTRYVGPGRVTLALDTATSLGGSMGTAVFKWQGQKYTRDTLHEAPDEFLALLRERGVDVPDVAASALPALTDIDGVGADTEAALVAAGYVTVAMVATADPDALTADVAGVGAATAPKLVESAQELAT